MNIRVAGIIIGLLFVGVSIAGFTSLAMQGGAGPEISWSVGMGPFVFGTGTLLLSLSTKQKGEKNGYFMP